MNSRRRLSDVDIDANLLALPGWVRHGDAIRKTYAFPDFAEAISFVNRVAEAAESMDHHPDIDVRYDQVTLTLSTHSSGGLTPLDFELARLCDERFN